MNTLKSLNAENYAIRIETFLNDKGHNFTQGEVESLASLIIRAEEGGPDAQKQTLDSLHYLRMRSGPAFTLIGPLVDDLLKEASAKGALTDGAFLTAVSKELNTGISHNPDLRMKEARIASLSFAFRHPQAAVYKLPFGRSFAAAALGGIASLLKIGQRSEVSAPIVEIHHDS
jgi:hypothetical protein